MKSKRIFLISFVFMVTMLVSGCDFSLAPTDNMALVQTAAAQTVEVRLTQSVFETLVAQLTDVIEETEVPPTETVQPQEAAATQTPTATLTPTTTQTQVSTLTNTPVPASPTATKVPATNTSTPVPCDWAGFVKDVTVPDGTEFDLSESFVKTWRLKNIGSCTWNSDYDLVFVSGNAMNGPAAVSIGTTVRPGETVDLSVKLKAPDEEGEYTGYWKLRNASNAIFGLGANAGKSFWVQIEVNDDSGVWDPDNPLDFVSTYCVASWRNSDGPISCPGAVDNFENGSVTRSSSPKLEGGYQEDEPTLITIPDSGGGGFISGRYPAIKIKDGDHFTALVGCLNDSPKCDVDFVLNYRVDGGSVQNLGGWTEEYDGDYTRIDIDLSSLSGKKVEFILRVDNNDSSKDDRAFWVAPKIRR